MNRWTRKTPLGSWNHSGEVHEVWEFSPTSGKRRAFPVRVRTGKRLDVVGLKGTELQKVRDYSSFLKDMATRLYSSSSTMARQEACPICGARLSKASVALRIFEVPYLQCERCGHVCVGFHLAQTASDGVFAEAEEYSAVYVDVEAIKIRLEQIVQPKLDWCIEHFRERNGRSPRNVVDVGAGGGHFLAGASRCGMRVEGFEKSKSSRAFIESAFGLQVRDDDFLSAPGKPTDLITFWGLLEYVSRPRDFIAASKQWLTREGMLVVEVPRVESLGTMVQAMPNAVIARHMDPTSHVNGFSDESLCTALVEEGFSPIAAWYFGMDAYEACVQVALRDNASCLSGSLIEFLPILQQALDLGRMCDDLIVAAVRS
jgi:2-polyprenyl-3-methyl-5-hydroxy-6-metoxy-1,4-benzoquinol methylase